MKKETSLAAQVRKIKLPSKCYAIDPDNADRIIPLTHLRVDEPKKAGCLCLSVKGRMDVDDGKTAYGNEYVVELSKCFANVEAAVQYIGKRRRWSEKQSFINKHNSYRQTKMDGVRLIKQYPVLIKAELIERDGEGPDELKHKDFLRAYEEGGFSRIFKQIVNIHFPDLIDDEPDEDD